MLNMRFEKSPSSKTDFFSDRQDRALNMSKKTKVVKVCMVHTMLGCLSRLNKINFTNAHHSGVSGSHKPVCHFRYINEERSQHDNGCCRQHSSQQSPR